jgi:hypothetical protein
VRLLEQLSHALLKPPGLRASQCRVMVVDVELSDEIRAFLRVVGGHPRCEQLLKRHGLQRRGCPGARGCLLAFVARDGGQQQRDCIHHATVLAQRRSEAVESLLGVGEVPHDMRQATALATLGLQHPALARLEFQSPHVRVLHVRHEPVLTEQAIQLFLEPRLRVQRIAARDSHSVRWVAEDQHHVPAVFVA